jgi:GNAT superfamily N-acetyltransferase
MSTRPGDSSSPTEPAPPEAASPMAILLAPAYRRRAGAVLTRAFMDDPIYSFLFPDPIRRARYTSRMWNALVHTALVCGKVYTTPSFDGVACWIAPGNADLTFVQALRTGFALPLAVGRFPPKARKQMLRGIGVFERERRRLNPKAYWYLQALGVEPARQGRGVGAGLLAPILSIASEQGLPCYLETETEGNVTFYGKQGFRVLSTLEFPDSPLRLWTMSRPPS